MEKYMESELSGIFRAKLVTKNIERGSPGTQFMHMRVNNECSYPKAQSIENQNKLVLRKLVKKCKLVLINSLRKYQMTKTSARTIFQNGKVMLCHQ